MPENIVEHKSLLKLSGNENVIQRQVRLLKTCGVTDITLIVNKETDEKIKNCLPEDVKVTQTTYEAHENAFIEMLHTRHLWVADGDTLILLGDLVYTKKALMNMLTINQGEITVFGTPSSWVSWREVFAVKLSNPSEETITKLCSLDPKKEYDLWNIPKQLNLPMQPLDECTDLDLLRQLEEVKRKI